MKLLDASTLATLNQLGDYARSELSRIIARHGAAAQITGAGSLFQIHWTRQPLRDTRGVETANDDFKMLTFLGLANRGFHISVRGMCALATPMTRPHVDTLVAAFEDVVLEMAREGWAVTGE